MEISPQIEAAFRRYIRSLRAYEAAYRHALNHTSDPEAISAYHRTSNTTANDLAQYEFLCKGTGHYSEELGFSTLHRIAQGQ